MLNKLKEALNKSEKPERKQQAAGWKIFKSAADWRRATRVYIMRIDPVVKGQEYDITPPHRRSLPGRSAGSVREVQGCVRRPRHHRADALMSMQ